jgi:hypothetical protein
MAIVLTEAITLSKETKPVKKFICEICGQEVTGCSVAGDGNMVIADTHAFDSEQSTCPGSGKLAYLKG